MASHPPISDLQQLRDTFQAELHNGMKFWLKFSHDEEYGGFFNCLTEDGQVYDTHKYGWFQCRQIWTYAYLYQNFDEFRTTEVLEAAKKGLQFVRDHLPMRHLSGHAQYRCYFAVTRDGKPYRIQRKPFTECFYVIALFEMGKVLGDESLKAEAHKVLAAYAHWLREDSSDLGAPVLEGQPPVSPLNKVMMLLSMIMLTVERDSAFFKEHAKWCVDRILQHSQGSYVLEILDKDLKPIEGSEGRLLNPGHAIEAGWFLLDYWQKFDSQNVDLLHTAIDKFVTAPMSYGWDEEFGGLFYFMDKDGFPPVHLEWDMKLWWPHCEALIACLMAYRHTGDAQHWQAFSKVADYSLAHYPDKKNGEWFGYLNRRGEVSQTLKGGPYKGCFHTVRCWALCVEHLDAIIAKQQQQ